MAISNRERQKRFRETRMQAGDSRVTCWLAEDDNQRLRRLMEILSDASESKIGYSDVINLALKELEVSLTPPEHRNMVRYGLLLMDNRRNAPFPTD